MNGRWDPLIATYRPGRSLERAFYTDPDLFEADMERVFLRHWLFAGHASRIPRPGDYFLYEVAGESVIVVRGRDGGINALLNVCAHRGSRVCLEASGHAARLVCPYHAWSYELDGSLATARNMPEGFERNGYGLRRLAVEVVEDLIHVCFAEEPPDLSAVTADIRKFFQPHGWTRAKVAAREAVVIPANWKAVAENFLECYHCPPTHPELNQVMSYVRAYDSPRHAEERRQLIERWNQQARDMGHPSGSHKSAEGVCHTVARIPIREGFLTQSRDGRGVAPLMGELKAYDGGVTAIQFYPIHWFVANNDYGMLARFTPLTVQETEAELTWLVDREAREGVDYSVEAITWLWQNTMREDVEITRNNQAGINSRYYRPGPHSKDENLDEFYRWYLRCLRLLIIPDIHNAVGWAEAILNRFESAVDRTVFLGDYFDSWDDNRVQARESARWLQAGLSHPRRIYLFGNHDISYYAAGQATLCSGWTPEKAAVIEAVLRPARGPDHWSALKCFHLEDGWLFTHAGMRSDLLQPPDLRPPAPAMDELFRRALANVSRNVADPVFGAGEYRLGTFALGGVTWLDFNEAWECRERLAGYHQVVGHSALPIPRSIIRDADGFSTVALEGNGSIPIAPPAQSFNCIDGRGRAFAIVDTARSTLTLHHCEDGPGALVVARETVLRVAPIG